jgi:hypothetical protein
MFSVGVLSVEKKVVLNLDGSTNDGSGNCILFVGWEKPKGDDVVVPTKLERIVLFAAVVDECNSRR